MKKYGDVDTGCRMVGEYVDEGEVPENLAHLKNSMRSNSQVELTRFVAHYIDSSSDDGLEREFKILLIDHRIVSVRGHSLKFVQNAGNPQDFGSYGIVSRQGDTEVLVALFRVVEVQGVFTGDPPVSMEPAVSA